MDFDQPVIRIATESDAPLLAKLSEKTFRDSFSHMNRKQDFEVYVNHAFTEDQITSELLDSASTFFIAKTKHQWAGYAKLSQSLPPECVQHVPAIELSRLYAAKQYIGLGIGSTLMKTCINFARAKGYRSIWLGSWKKNLRGNAFYKKMNFKVIGAKTFIIGSDIQEDYVFEKSI